MTYPLQPVLFGPRENIIPLNDNLYVFLNGTAIGVKGTSYGAVFTTSFHGPTQETDGWSQDGSFGAAAALQPGLNVLDIVAEDWCLIGGLGRLNLKLRLAAP